MLAVSALLGGACARAVVGEDIDAAYSGNPDIGALPSDIVGVNWDDYPDKGNLLDVRDVPAARDQGAATRDVPAAVDATVPITNCGRPGEPCCALGRCASGGTCRGGVCAETPTCGATGQPCCGVAACGPGNSCTGGRCASMLTCGASGGPCCASTTPCLPSLLCLSGSCAPCGGAGQACCAGTTTCFRGYSCSGGLCRTPM